MRGWSWSSKLTPWPQTWPGGGSDGPVSRHPPPVQRPAGWAHQQCLHDCRTRHPDGGRVSHVEWDAQSSSNYIIMVRTQYNILLLNCMLTCYIWSSKYNPLLKRTLSIQQAYVRVAVKRNIRTFSNRVIIIMRRCFSSLFSMYCSWTYSRSRWALARRSNWWTLQVHRGAVM